MSYSYYNEPDNDTDDHDNDYNLNDSSEESLSDDDNTDYVDRYRHLCERFGYTMNISACTHCQNKCKVICNDCNKSYGCHKCHNEKILNSVSTTEHHELKTKKITQVICMNCDQKQEFSQQCQKCKIIFADYICYECNVMMNVSPDLIFHCDKCKACLIKDNINLNYIHCDKCDNCIDSRNISNHICKKKSSDSVCSICYENSRNRISVIMICGHTLHQDCYEMLIKSNYKCPECSKTITDTSRLFRQMEREIRNNPLPPELIKNVNIQCVDCSAKNTVKYHFVGNQCPQCKSFNTYNN